MRIADATVVVTGGTGFLGRHVSEELEAYGAKVFALGSSQYDLRRRAEAARMLADTRPDAVVHLAAVVGGIGANQAAPGRFFYENALMGIELIEACRVAGVPKVVVAGTVCAYPKYAPVPFQEDRPVGRLPGGDQRPLRAGQEDAPRSGAGVPGPVRHEYRLSAAGQSLRSAR